MPKVALSYRRSDSKAIARLIFEHLQKKYKDAVFMDVEKIPPGVLFPEYIARELSNSKVLLAIIGPNWLGINADGTKRIDMDDDYVRFEIEIAMRKNLTIIPVLVDGAQMPNERDLPAQIKHFSKLNAISVDTGVDFGNHITRLLKYVEQASPSFNYTITSILLTSTIVSSLIIVTNDDVLNIVSIIKILLTTTISFFIMVGLIKLMKNVKL